MPLTLLEAMSFKKCCLVSCIPENSSVIKDNGVTFKKSNIQDLKEIMEYLLERNDIVQEI